MYTVDDDTAKKTYFRLTLPRQVRLHNSSAGSHPLSLARQGTMSGHVLPRLRNHTASQEPSPTHKNLYVLNLPLDATTDQLTALFAGYGSVVHCVILAMLDAQARRRGFIDMSSAVEAKEAIEGLNGFVWHGYPIEVSYAIVQRSGGPFDQTIGRSIIKRNVPRNRFNTGPRRIPSDSAIDASMMAGLAQQFGRQTSIGSMNVNGDSLVRPREERDTEDGGAVVDPFTIFIAGLDPVAIIDDDDFRSALEPYGAITAATLCRDENGTSRGFGIVTFASQQAATNACESINGKVINGRRLTAHKYVYQANGPQGISSPLAPSGLPLTAGSNPYSRRPLPSAGANANVSASSNTFGSAAMLQQMTVLPMRFTARSPIGMTSPMWPPTPPSPYNPMHQVSHGQMGSLASVRPALSAEAWDSNLYRRGPAAFFKANTGNRAVEIKPDPNEKESNANKDAASHSTALGDAFVHMPKSILQERTNGNGASLGRRQTPNAPSPSPPTRLHDHEACATGTHAVLTRTPIAHGSPWSTSTNASPNSLGLDGMSPQSTLSTTSTASSLSHLQTPDASRNRDSAGIWLQSQGSLGGGIGSTGGNRGWVGTDTGPTSNKHANMTGSAILSLQSDIVEKSGRTSLPNLAPVGHEKTSSPMRVTRPNTEGLTTKAEH